jgi:hypothetical protein
MLRVALLSLLLLLVLAPASQAGPVATNDAAYTALGRVFPDPMGGCQAAGTSPCDPNAQGNVPAQTHIGWQEFLDGASYMNQATEKGWPRYMELLVLDGKLGEGSATKAEVESNPGTMAPGNNLAKLEWSPRPEYQSAGLPTSGLGRVKSDLVIVRVTDETVPDAGKKRYTLSLSIHGIERAGAEGGIRAMEDIVTSVGTDRFKQSVLPKEVKEGAATFEDVLKKTIVYFTFPNPDGWRRGSVSQGGFAFQRYNGNGIDPNRDYPDIGYSFRGYSGNSEPETRAFYDFYKGEKRDWHAGDDLHGQPFADALSYTLMPHGRHHLGKDTRIRETMKTINRAQYEATKWSPQIVDNDQPVGGPAGCLGDTPVGTTCGQIYAQTWGSVYDTINYTTTGTLGDWFDSRTVGINADGIDNEMSFSHIDRNIVFERHGEQLHVEGNKSIIYAHLADMIDQLSGVITTPGKNAYVPNKRVKRDRKVLDPGPPLGTKPQDDVVNGTGTPDPAANGLTTYKFEVQRTEQIYNGGMRVDVTGGNVQGVQSGSVGLSVQCRGCDEHVGVEENAGPDDWITVGEDYNQSPIYAQAGATVAINRPDAKKGDGSPVEWRALVYIEDLTEQTRSPIGPVRVDIDFSSSPASFDGPTGGDQPSVLEAYDAANTDFFHDLNRFFPDRSKRFEPLDPAKVIGGSQSLSGLKNLVLADALLPGYTGPYKGEPAGEGDGPGDYTPAQKDAWVAKLRDFVTGGGNLVLTDGALRGIGELTSVPGDAVARATVYVGQVSWQRCADDACAARTSTIEDPLARNVAQPGSRFNSDARRQTFEPTPLGFAIQDKSGNDQSNARQYDIDHKAFTAAGGRIAATSADAAERAAVGVPERVTIGELGLGKGTIRVAGALLPQPTNEFDHPLGLEPYALTYTGYLVFCNLIDADCLPTRSGVVDDDAAGGGKTPTIACAATAGFKRTAVTPRGRGLRLELARNLDRPATVDVFATSKGRRVLRNRRVAHFTNRTKTFDWNGKGKKVADGIYFVRYRMKFGAVNDTRRHVLQRKGGKWVKRPDFYGKASCGLFRSLKLESPAIGGRTNVPLKIAYRMAQASKVTVTIRRGKQVVRRYKARSASAGRTVRIKVPSGVTARRGDYRVRVVARRAGRTVAATLTARRL